MRHLRRINKTGRGAFNILAKGEKRHLQETRGQPRTHDVRENPLNCLKRSEEKTLGAKTNEEE